MILTCLIASYYKHTNNIYYMLPQSCDCTLLILFSPYYNMTSGLVSSTGYIWFTQEAIYIYDLLNPNKIN